MIEYLKFKTYKSGFNQFDRMSSFLRYILYSLYLAFKQIFN